MNAKDLLTALNDIDPKLLEDVEPWGEPAQPLRRRPLWAVAAGLVLALGLGTGGLFLAQHLSALPAEYQQSQEEGVQQDSAAAQAVELEFASDTRDSLQSLTHPDGATTRDLSQREIAGIWGQEELVWAGVSLSEKFDLSGSVIHSSDGSVWMVSLTAKTKSTGANAFHLELSPEGLPPTCLPETPPWNNTVFETPVYAARSAIQGQELFVAELVYSGEETVGLRAGISSQEEGLTSQEAENLLASLVEQSIRGGIHLEGLAQGAAGLELSFTSRPATDNAFSNVWNTFTTLYLEPQNLAAHNAKPDYTLTEEELASLWKGAPPWESFLTENDTVEAYGYFSDAGQLIKVYIGGYRDSPEIPGTQAYPLFNVTFYNTALTGEWGQAAENALALADTTFQGVDIATQRTESRMDYEDGTSMDFSDYGALFQPEQGPVLISVDGFYSPVAFTRETAQSFVEQVTEEILTHGVDLSGITGAP